MHIIIIHKIQVAVRSFVVANAIRVYGYAGCDSYGEQSGVNLCS